MVTTAPGGYSMAGRLHPPFISRWGRTPTGSKVRDGSLNGNGRRRPLPTGEKVGVAFMRPLKSQINWATTSHRGFGNGIAEAKIKKPTTVRGGFFFSKFFDVF
ncbi:MAG: hypothetical protein AMJ91_07485 [candidate division Zixibacteria bacterium SM23_73_3]|nr:MAG: hypothetical protein AMJ91_07485 [candidate division Zixibacteria bacterium SM23_73_3]